MAGRVTQIDTATAKRIVLDRRREGLKVADAMALADRSAETWRDWRKTDPAFAAEADEIVRSLKEGTPERPTTVPDFPEFCEQYLGQAMPLHQLRAWDVVQGLPPRDLTESMMFRPNGPDVIMNFPPNHGKSTTWTINYVIWRIHQDPNIRILIVSKSQRLAKNFLSAIKNRLTNPNQFREMHAAFAPGGGWEGDTWREDSIRVAGRDSGDPDPTIQALGMGGQIYGARADLIILDDVEDISSAHDYAKHADWVAQDVATRLEPVTGRILVVATRVGVMDMSRYLRDSNEDPDDDEDGTLPSDIGWTYFAQPAILEGVGGPWTDWEVLWPERMTSKEIRRLRSKMPDKRRFEFVYQQNDVSLEATFPMELVMASVNGSRSAGVMRPGAQGHALHGQDGMYVVAGWDPASSAGGNAMVAVAVDRKTGKRWVLDVFYKRGALAGELIERLKLWTVELHVNEWRIEKNAVQEFITQLPEIRNFLASRGVRLTEHTTNRNKWDSDVGVETLAPLFESCVLRTADGVVTPKTHDQALIELPATRSVHVQALTDQLQTWEPDMKRRQPQDLVMALWFAELGVRQWLVGSGLNQPHRRGRFLTRAQRSRQVTLPVESMSPLVRPEGDLFYV